MQSPDEPVAAGGGQVYLVKSVLHATQVLWAFEHPGEALRLRDVMARTGLSKGMCFRLLFTLHHCGFLEKVEGSRFRLTTEIRRRTRHRIGYAAQGQDSSFPREVRDGLTAAAQRHDVDLTIVDNRYQPKVALRNAELLIRDGVELVIEFQTDEAVAPAIASKYLQAGIPFVAIDIPHPGATYFGANNYEAGLLAGRYLARYAKQVWGGRVDEILLLELARAGSLVQARMRGVIAGIRETLREASDAPVVSLDGDGQFKTAIEKVRRHLRTSTAPPRAGGRRQRPVGARRRPGVPGGGPGADLRDRRPERRGRRPHGTAGGAQPPGRLRRLLPREVRRRAHSPRARHPRAEAGAAGRVHPPPTGDARQRRPPLPERRAHQPVTLWVSKHEGRRRSAAAARACRGRLPPDTRPRRIVRPFPP